MKTFAIVQARMSSSRLYGKVLADLCGDTMLGRVVARLRAAKTIDRIVVATSTEPTDDPIMVEAGRLGCGVHRGSIDDVLARYVGAARRFRADAYVRITSDCPLIDPDVVDAVVAALPGYDYASNTHARTYPRGLDVEAFYADTLERIGRLATSPAAREHVTAFAMERPALFKINQVCADADDSDLRWTVDTADDLSLIRTLYSRFDLGSAIRPYYEVVSAVRAEPALATANAHVAQKAWQHVA